LGDRNSGQRTRHVERRALKKRRHELAAQAPKQRNRDREKQDVDEDRQLAVSECEIQNRQIEALRKPRSRIL
jgi:hypothetical protein